MLGTLVKGVPDQLGYMPADPPKYSAAVNGPDGVGWMKSMEEENRWLLDQDVEGVDPPRDAQIIPSKYIFKWKYNEAGCTARSLPASLCPLRHDFTNELLRHPRVPRHSLACLESLSTTKLRR